MKKLIWLLVFLSFTAWGADKSIVKASKADKQYQVEVKCFGLPDQKYFEFMSDLPAGGLSGGGLKDINGDGVTIRGWMYNARMPDGTKKQKFGFEITENGIEYMNADLKSWKKSSKGVIGSGSLKKQQDDFASFPATFEVSCK